MGRLSTHVLDTANGRPARGVAVTLDRVDGDRLERVTSAVTNADGRTDAPLMTGDAFRAGTYLLTFDIGTYFTALNQPGAGQFLGHVPIRFTIADPDGHYHVPLVCTPWSYSTYRGS